MTLTLQCAPLPSLTLFGHDIHLWLADLDVAASSFTVPEETVSPAELARAERYLHERDRQRSLAARAILRNLLGMYTGIPPQEIILHYHPNGKPFLVGNSSSKTLQFNLAHSANIALYTFSWDRQVGVDIELIRNTADIETLARRVLTDEEYAAFQKCTAKDKPQLFYRYWTYKEAVVKASGGTLNEMSRIYIPPRHGASTDWIKVNRGTPSASWMVREITPLPGYAAAVAAESMATPSFRMLNL